MPEPDDIAAIASELRVVVSQLVRRFRSDGPLPTPQITALAALSRNGEQTTSSLAALERMRPQSMAHTVGELERQGLVARRPDPSDGRQQLIGMTPVGRELLDEYRRAGESWVAAALAEDFGPDERATIAASVDLLRRLSQS